MGNTTQAEQSDAFLGEWQVSERVYAPSGDFLGMVDQVRRLSCGSQPGEIVVHQECSPRPELNGRAMADFAGTFAFSVQKTGPHRRHYLGPDVHGSAAAVGGKFLVGEGMWPRFGYAFRSWSISLDAGRQLTGGQFYRGADVHAVIVGYGVAHTAGGMQSPPAAWPARKGAFIATGQRVSYDLGQGMERTQPLQRRADGDLSWSEWDDMDEISYALEPRSHGYLVRRNRRIAGTAMQYGPALMWEVFGDFGLRISGLDITSPDGTDHFSLRCLYRHGTQTRIDGIHFTIT